MRTSRYGEYQHAARDIRVRELLQPNTLSCTIHLCVHTVTYNFDLSTLLRRLLMTYTTLSGQGSLTLTC